jgi:hypothetical protein
VGHGIAHTDLVAALHIRGDFLHRYVYIVALEASPADNILAVGILMRHEDGGLWSLGGYLELCHNVDDCTTGKTALATENSYSR